MFKHDRQLCDVLASAEVELLGAKWGLAASAPGASRRGCLHTNLSFCTWNGSLRRLLREVGKAGLCLCIMARAAMLVLHIIIGYKHTDGARKEYFWSWLSEVTDAWFKVCSS